MRALSCLLCIVVVALAAAPALAGESSLYRGPAPRPGPDALYDPPADAPQLQNAGIWEAPPILVSGSTAYRRGEFLYQDWLYDDHGARSGPRDRTDPRSDDDTFSAPYGTYTYPTDAKYAQNAADLVELRVRQTAEDTVFRLTYNTLIDANAVATTIALGDAVPVAQWPHGSGARSPAEIFLTVHGDRVKVDDLTPPSGDAVCRDTPEGRECTIPETLPPSATARVDAERRQVEVRFSRRLFDPGRGRVRMAAATGLWDAANDRYLMPASTATATQPGGRSGAGAAFYNVAFRSETSDPDGAAPGEEPLPQLEAQGGSQSLTDPRFWRDKAQGDALATGDLSPFFAMVDFAKLADRAEDDSDVPRTGVLNRILASHHEPRQGVDFNQECGRPVNCEGELLGRLQPYAIYVPARTQPASGWSLTLLLHSLGANYNQFSGTRNQSQFGERGRGSIVITPAGRGPDGWYYGLAGADTFEVWADVARHYELDPAFTTIAGYSMGGYGTYKFATRYPDLFARAQPTVGPPTLGVSTTARDSSSSPSTSTNFLLPSVRHIPFMMWVASTDQLVPITGTTAQAQTFDDLGYRYIFDVYSPADHFTLAINDQFRPAADFLDDAQVVRDPAHVTYVVNPKMDFPEVRTVGDHAYWLSGLRVRNGDGEAPRGLIDVRSEAFGTGDPEPTPTRTSAGTISDTQNAPFLQYTRREKDWGATPQAAARDALTITASNVRTVTINAQRAKVTCRAALDVRTDGPITVNLEGCPGGPQTFGAGRSSGCTAAVGFVRARASGAGRRVRFDAAPLGDRRFTVDVFRQSRGRRILGERRVARFRNRRGSFTWSGRGRRVGDGFYLVRYRTRVGRRVDTRRVVLQRRRGRFRVRPDFYRRASCGDLTSFKLERPVFGGRRNRPLGIAFRLSRPARVRVDVLRGKRLVRRLMSGTRRGRLTHRLRLPSERLRRGDHRVRIRVTPRGGRTVTATLVSRRL